MKNSPLITTRVRIADTLLAAFRTYSDRVVYEEADRAYRACDHASIIASMAAELAANYGVKPGDRVAVVAETSQPYIALWHGALLGYFTIVPLNHRLAPPEIKAILESSGASVVVHDALHQPIADSLAEDLGIKAAAIEALASTSLDPLEQREDIREEEIPVIVYTGGTTGLPKGVAISQKTFGAVAHRYSYSFDTFATGSCHYTTSPLFHMSGYVYIYGPVLSGNRTVVVPRFDMQKLLEDVPKYQITQLGMVPVMLDLFLDAIESNPVPYQHLRYIIYGGAPVSTRTIQRVKALLPGAKLQQNYGMTESATALTLLDASDHDRGGKYLQSAGRVLPGIELQIRTSEGKLAQTGESGEIHVRADLMMSGYWGNKEATDAAIVDGWYKTGDIGYLNEEGFLYVIDRAKDMIVTGGENVYSLEVERAIEKVAQVEQVAVIGIPSEAWGEQVHAILVPVAGVKIDSDELLKALRKELAGYKCPKTIELRNDLLPLTAVGKINKVALRKEYWSDHDKNVN